MYPGYLEWIARALSSGNFIYLKSMRLFCVHSKSSLGKSGFGAYYHKL